jgi:hypothetical protein
MDRKEDTLTFLLALNEELAEKEADGIPVVGPGLPATIQESQTFVSSDCVRVGAQP